MLSAVAREGAGRGDRGAWRDSRGWRMDGWIRASLAATGGTEPPLSPAEDTHGSPLPDHRRGTAGTEGTAGNAASKAALELRLRRPPRGQSILGGIPGGHGGGDVTPMAGTARAGRVTQPSRPRSLPTPERCGALRARTQPLRERASAVPAPFPVTFHVPSPMTGMSTPV